MAAKQIIILEQVEGQPGYTAYRVAYWLAVPAARQPFYADATKTSVWGGASGAELTALQNGSVVEVVETYSVAATQNLAQVKTALQANWTAKQAQVNARNPWGFYSSSWDGTSWTNVTVA